MYIVYLLRSLATAKTYVGCTNDPKNRIRRHNREITGGAKRTRTGGPWVYHLHIRGFRSRREALQFEWHWQHPKRGIGRGCGRIGSLERKMHELRELRMRFPHVKAIKC